jgi:hypothetical protein
MRGWIGCISGAVPIEEYLEEMRRAGFEDVAVVPVPGLDALEDVQDPLYKRIVEKLPAATRPVDFIASVRVTGRRPAAK